MGGAEGARLSRQASMALEHATAGGCRTPSWWRLAARSATARDSGIPRPQLSDSDGGIPDSSVDHLGLAGASARCVAQSEKLMEIGVQHINSRFCDWTRRTGNRPSSRSRRRCYGRSCQGRRGLSGIPCPQMMPACSNHDENGPDTSIRSTAFRHDTCALFAHPLPATRHSAEAGIPAGYHADACGSLTRVHVEKICTSTVESLELKTRHSAARDDELDSVEGIMLTGTVGNARRFFGIPSRWA